MNRSIIALAITAILIAPASATWGGNNDKGGNADANAQATAYAAGGSANVHNANRNSNRNSNANLNHNANRNTNRNTNSNLNHQGQGQGQLQGQLQGQGQDQSQSAMANSNQTQSLSNVNDLSNSNSNGQSQSSDQANSQSLNSVYNEAKQDYSDTYEDYTPSAAAYAAPPSARCVITGGVGFGVPGISGSATGGVIDYICQALEVARAASLDPDAKVRARGSYLRNLLTEKQIIDLENDPAFQEAVARVEGKPSPVAKVRSTEQGVFALTNY